MRLMDILVTYVKGAFHLVSSDELVNVSVFHGYQPAQASGAVGSAVRLGLIEVKDTKTIHGRKINFFR